MVKFPVAWLPALAQASAEDTAKALPLEHRAALLMALLGVALLGGLLMLVARLGARRVRRLARQNRPKSRGVDRTQWYRKPLNGKVDTTTNPTEPAE